MSNCIACDQLRAQVAAMRRALANVLAERYRLGSFADKAERMAEVARAALDDNAAGRILERRYQETRTALARAEQDNARLRAVLAWAADEIMALHSALGELRGCIIGRA